MDAKTGRSYLGLLKLLVVGGICDQKTSKFFESQWEESIIGPMDVFGVY
jgi:hypothetical protein